MDEGNEKAILTDRLKGLYNNYRTSLLNRKYYGHRLVAYQKYNRMFEIVIAIGTSSVIGGGQSGKGFL